MQDERNERMELMRRVQLLHGTEENPVTVVVVSNRIARAKTDEPVAGGLAAALIPMVKESGAIWVGSSGQTSDYAASRDCFSQIEPLGTGALATVDMPTQTLSQLLRGFRQFGACGRRCIRARI